MSQPRQSRVQVAPAPAPGEPVVETTSEATWECDLCGELFRGEPFGSGLFVTVRGDEVRYEEPPLCESCAMGITLGALARWRVDDDDEG